MSSQLFNKLPLNWQQTELLNICQVRTGKRDANHAVVGGAYRFYTCAFEHMYCNTIAFNGECIILPGNGANVGEVFYFNGEFDAYQRTYVVFDIKINPDFLFYHFKYNWKKDGVKLQFGSATNYIKIGNFKNYKVSYPSLSEQQRIVSKIDSLFAKIDKAIALTEESLKQAENLLPALLDEIFTNLSYSNKIVELSQLCEFKNGFAFKSREFNQTGLGIQVLRIGNVLDENKNPVFILEDSKYSDFLLKENDIVISMTGTRLKKDYLFVRIIKKKSCYLNQRVGKISSNSTTYFKYLYYYLKSNMFRSKIFDFETGAVNQGNISGKAIMKMLIPKISFEEQKQVSIKCNDISKKAQQTILNLNNQLKYLRDIKSSILSKAFLGEL